MHYREWIYEALGFGFIFSDLEAGTTIYAICVTMTGQETSVCVIYVCDNGTVLLDDKVEWEVLFDVKL